MTSDMFRNISTSLGMTSDMFRNISTSLGMTSDKFRNISTSLGPRICSVCCNYNPVLYSFLTYHKVCNKSNANVCHVPEQGLFTLPEYLSSPIPIFSGVCVARSLVFCVVLRRWLLVLFSFGIVLSAILRITASDYPFDIFKFSFFLTYAF
jgi:hypothetical protein